MELIGTGPKTTPRTLDTLNAVAALNAAAELLASPPDLLLPRLSRTLGDTVPHLAAAELSTHCAHSPFKTTGDPEVPGRMSAAEMDRLVATVAPGHPLVGPSSAGPSVPYWPWPARRRPRARSWCW
ncbi:hypothetical protein [Streptomyces sp. NPDC048473]|uniref:hypothetical protein n=1 Tax=unclassified Streptomyces TaxID=2593676 RepID=UPI00371C3254